MRPSTFLISLLTLASTVQLSAQASKQVAEGLITKSCANCHAGYLKADGTLDEVVVSASAAQIVERVNASERPMPPANAPAGMQLTADEKAQLSSYVKTLVAAPDSATAQGPLAGLKLEPGFSIEVFAQVVGARSLAVHETGTVFVGTGGFSNVDPEGRVSAIVPIGQEQKVVALISKLNNPNGVALHNNDLYIAEATQIGVIRNAVQLAAALAKGERPDVKYEVIKADLRVQGQHAWKYLAVGPDSKLYLNVGADCNSCREDLEVGAGIFRLNLDGSGYELVARGVRNSVGVAFHPETKEMWFTDNGRDMLGDTLPADELNVLTRDGQNFGFPHCFGAQVIDPDFGDGFTCQEELFSRPAVELGAHVAALGLTFYTGSQFPASFKNQIFIAEHGSWNSRRKVGYRLSTVEKTAAGLSYKPFISGWVDAEGKANWGRPVDVKTYTDGSLLLSDDQGGVVYRISYKAAN